MVTVQNLLAETMSVPRETPSAAVTSGSVECAEKISKRIGSTSPGTSSLLLPDGVNPVDKPSPSVQPAAVRLQNPARTRAAPKTRGTRASKRARKQATTTGMIATTITGNMVSRPPAVPPAVALASAVTPAAAALTSPGQQTQQRGAGTATGGSNADPGSGESKTVDQQRQSSAISHSTDNIAGSVPLRDDEDLDPGRGVAAQQRMSLAACLNGDTGAPAAATARIATAASFTTFAAAGIVVPDVDDPIPALVTAVNPHEHNQQSGMPFQSSRPISIVTAATATSNAC
ncbi:unnamed protein product, partial [Sphacelaria rigidula]